MPMGDELAGAALGMTQRSMEVGVEIIKMLAPLVKKLWDKQMQGMEARKSGRVTQSELVMAANEAKSALKTESNILSSDIDKYAAKAKEYGIPISIVGDGNKYTMSYRECDLAVIKQITEETIRERFQDRERKDSFKSFPIKESNLKAMHAEFEKNGIECQFCGSADGKKIYCTFPAKDAERVNMIKQEFKSAREEVAKNFAVTPDPSRNGLGTITDAQSGKTINLDQFGGSVKKYQIVNLLQKEFGYSKTQADLAANKLCDELKLNPKDFLSVKLQTDIINSMKTNIRFDNDDILLKNVKFNEINFKDGENTHIFVSVGDRTACITPNVMTEKEIRDICVTELEMTPQQADEATKKALKINTQINAKVKGTAIYRSSEQGNTQTMTVDINRTSNNSFTISVGSVSHEYDLSDENAAEKIGKDFGISVGKAQTFVNKAQKQNAFINNLQEKTKEMGRKTKEVLSRAKDNIPKPKRGAK